MRSDPRTPFVIVGSAFPVRASGKGFLNAVEHWGKLSWRCSLRRRIWHLSSVERKGTGGGFQVFAGANWRRM